MEKVSYTWVKKKINSVTFSSHKNSSFGSDVNIESRSELMDPVPRRARAT